MSVSPAQQHALYGEKLIQSGHFYAGIREYRQALEILPDYPEVLNNSGDALLRLGRVEQAIGMFRRAVCAAPRVPTIASNYLCALNYSDHLTPEQIASQHIQVGARLFGASKTVACRVAVPGGRARKLRIGMYAPV